MGERTYVELAPTFNDRKLHYYEFQMTNTSYSINDGEDVVQTAGNNLTIQVHIYYQDHQVGSLISLFNKEDLSTKETFLQELFNEEVHYLLVDVEQMPEKNAYAAAEA